MPPRKLPPRKLPPTKLPTRKLPPMKIPPMNIPPYDSSPLWKLLPEIYSWENWPLWKLPPLKSPPHLQIIQMKEKTKLQSFLSWRKLAIQHPYQNNHGPLWYADDLTENTGLRYFLYRIKKIKKSNESENRQMAFTCHLQFICFVSVWKCLWHHVIPLRWTRV